MLPYTDPRWDELEGGYRTAYDPRQALMQLEADVAVVETWAELWEELYHQGDVGSASYATVPHLARIHEVRDVPDWNTYALAGAIELAQRTEGNPPIPDWLQEGYVAAWDNLVVLATRDLARSGDPVLTRSALGLVALARGLKRCGELLLTFAEEEVGEMMSAYFGGGN